MIQINQTEFDAISRVDFNVFVERVFAELNPGTAYLDNFHIGLICAELERVRHAECKRLIVNVPPRGLKSIIASIAYPAFVLGHDPTLKIIVCSYGQELSEDLARDCRQVIQSAWYRRLFPRTVISPSRQAVHAFETTAGGGRMATSVGGPLTGFGGDVIIIDDPIKPEDADSEVERNRANRWYQNTLLSRLNDKTKGVIIVIMQRLHENDFVGHIATLDHWEKVSLPAIAQRDESHTVVTPFGSYLHHRAEGEALHPAREPLAELERLRRSMGTDRFAGQYLQNPMAPGGNLIKVEWFRYYEPGQTPKFDRIVQSWDTANKAKDTNDFTVCTTWGVIGQYRYLLDVYRKRMEYPELKRTVRELADIRKANEILIEDKGSGIQLIQELKLEGLHRVAAYNPRGDKYERLKAQTATIEAGLVFIPTAAHWLDAFLNELMLYPHSRYADQVDSLSQALDSIRPKPGGAQGWLDYGRWKLEQNRRARGDDL
jgi:predicted phage terminase large subunit-like protein